MCGVVCGVGGRSGSDLYGRILIVHCVVVGVVCGERDGQGLIFMVGC